MSSKDFIQPVIQHVLRHGNDIFPRFSAVLFNVFIRIFPVGKCRNTKFQTRLARDGNRPSSRFAAGAIHIIRDDCHIANAAQQLRLTLRECRTERSDDIGHSQIVNAHDIHVTFDQHRLFCSAYLFAGPFHREEQVAFMKDRRFR